MIVYSHISREGANVKLNRKTVMAGLITATAAFSATLFAQTTAPATAPASQPAVLAVINNQPIDANKFHEVLTAAFGLRMFEQIRDMVVAEQACRDAGFEPTSEEFNKKYVQAEIDRALSEIEAQGIPKANREAALAELVRRQGLTPVEFQMAMRRAAYLRVLAKGKANITDEQVDQAFNIEFDEKAIGRLVIIPPGLDAQVDVGKAIKDGRGPSEVQGVLQVQTIVLPRDEKLVREEFKSFHQFAFPANGQRPAPRSLSAWRTLNNVQGALYLDKYEPKREVKAADVQKEKDRIRKQLTEQSEVAWANQHLRNLVSRANIQINDPVLSNLYLDIARRMQAAQTQNATQPAGGAGTQPK